MNSPNEFTPAKGGAPVARMSKKPLLFVLIAGLILASVLVYAVNFSQKNKEVKARPPVETQPDKPLAAETAGSGLAVQPPAKEKPEPKPIAPDKQIVVVAPQKDERVETIRREREQLRRQKIQETTNALRAPMGVIKGGGQQPKVQAPGAHEAPKERNAPPPASNRAEALAGLTPDAYNPAADKDKEAFFARNADQKWLLSGTRMPGQPCELKTGSVIPGVMITGINSDLPGSIIAQVSQNVFDTANGAHLLIPQGSKLFGVYDSRVVYGQSRVLVAWNRIIFPDGSAVTLEAMPGGDMAGYAGFNDDVDNHYLRIFGSAVLMSLISGGLAYTMDSMSSTTAGPYGQTAPSLQNEMTSALGSQLGQTTTKLLEKNLNIKPTLGIRPGYQFNVIVTKDMVFEAPYAAWR